VLLDLSGCERLYPERGTLLAEINRELLKEGSFAMGAGEGSTRLVARLAAAVAPAGSWWSVEPSASASFLAPFPLRCVKDEFPEWVEALQELGLFTLGDLAAIPFELLHRALGVGVRSLWEDARGEGSHAVHHRLKPPLLRARHRFESPQSEPGLVASALGVLADRLAVALRSHRLVAGRIQLQLGFHGGTRVVRSRSLSPASDELEAIRRTTWALWRGESERRTAVTRCELRAELLRKRPAESLCFDFDKARKDLTPAIRSIRRRFGTTAIRWSPELWMD
jgi:nucleotidyltransferase/DNA polymerase involved in DNA repair